MVDNTVYGKWNIFIRQYKKMGINVQSQGLLCLCQLSNMLGDIKERGGLDSGCELNGFKSCFCFIKDIPQIWDLVL